MSEEILTVTDGGVNLPYEMQIWKDDSDDFTPMSAERLNHMEQGIKACSDACDSLSRIMDKVILNDGIQNIMVSKSQYTISLRFIISNNDWYGLSMSLSSTGGLSLIHSVNGKQETVWQK